MQILVLVPISMCLWISFFYVSSSLFIFLRWFGFHWQSLFLVRPIHSHDEPRWWTQSISNETTVIWNAKIMQNIALILQRMEEKKEIIFYVLAEECLRNYTTYKFNGIDFHSGWLQQCGCMIHRAVKDSPMLFMSKVTRGIFLTFVWLKLSRLTFFNCMILLFNYKG